MLPCFYFSVATSYIQHLYVIFLFIVPIVSYVVSYRPSIQIILFVSYSSWFNTTELWFAKCRTAMVQNSGLVWRSLCCLVIILNQQRGPTLYCSGRNWICRLKTLYIDWRVSFLSSPDWKLNPPITALTPTVTYQTQNWSQQFQSDGLWPPTQTLDF